MRELSGKSEARGRNGWFAPRQISVWAYSLLVNPDYKAVAVEVYSKQVGNTAPITLKLTLEDAKLLTGALMNAIVDASNLPAEGTHGN